MRLTRAKAKLSHDVSTGSGLADDAHIVTSEQLVVLARHNRAPVACDRADNEVPIRTVASADLAKGLAHEWGARVELGTDHQDFVIGQSGDLYRSGVSQQI